MAQSQQVKEKEIQTPIQADIETQGDTTIYTFADQMPVFQGGEKELFSFLGENVRYPKEAREAGIEGIVVHSFVVEKDGSITNIEMVKSLSPEIDKEALRVIKLTDKKWEPGMQEGEPVRLKYTLPMRFTIK